MTPREPLEGLSIGPSTCRKRPWKFGHETAPPLSGDGRRLEALDDQGGSGRVLEGHRSALDLHRPLDFPGQGVEYHHRGPCPLGVHLASQSLEREIQRISAEGSGMAEQVPGVLVPFWQAGPCKDVMELVEQEGLPSLR